MINILSTHHLDTNTNQKIDQNKTKKTSETLLNSLEKHHISIKTSIQQLRQSIINESNQTNTHQLQTSNHKQSNESSEIDLMSFSNMKYISSHHLQKYIQQWNDVNENETKNAIKIEINWIDNKPETVSHISCLNILLSNILVLNVSFQYQSSTSASSNSDCNPFISQLSIISYEEYFEQKSNEQYLESSTHSIFQKLSLHANIFYQQMNELLWKKYQTNENNFMDDVKSMNDLFDDICVEPQWLKCIHPCILSLHLLLHWLMNYRNLFQQSCEVCNQMLNYNNDGFGLLLPSIRMKFKGEMCAFHVNCISNMKWYEV